MPNPSKPLAPLGSPTRFIACGDVPQMLVETLAVGSYCGPKDLAVGNSTIVSDTITEREDVGSYLVHTGARFADRDGSMAANSCSLQLNLPISVLISMFLRLRWLILPTAACAADVCLMAIDEISFPMDLTAGRRLGIIISVVITAVGFLLRRNRAAEHTWQLRVELLRDRRRVVHVDLRSDD